MPPTVILVRHAQALHNVDNKCLTFFSPQIMLTNILYKTTPSMTQYFQSSAVNSVPS